MSDYTGQIINQGASVEYTISGSVNTTIPLTINDTVASVFAKSIEFSNTSNFAALVTPTAGKVIIQYSANGVNYTSFKSGGNISAKAGQVSRPAECSGDINFIRVVTSGITGANYIRVKFDAVFSFNPLIDERLYSGLQAFTTQSFTEANSKNGTQYEASFRNPAVTAGSNVDVIFITSSNPVLVKARQLTYNGSSLTADVYKSPSYTGGSVVPYYNLSDLSPVTGTVSILSSPTVSSTGTKSAATTYSYGVSGQGNSSAGTYVVTGIERVLAPNTAYLLRINNDSGSTQGIAGYVTWYEGPISSEI